MKALFIGGTGTISSAITDLLAADPDWELTLFNRGSRSAELPENVRVIRGDISDEAGAAEKLRSETFDVVADFIAFTPEQVERDIRLFAGRTAQYLFISSASAYQKPPAHYVFSESTPLCNPFWKYSRDKIACEDALLRACRADGFPVTIVRPSHTYCDRGLPVSVSGKKGCWQVIRRMMDGKPTIVHGDGTSLWTLTHSIDFARGFAGLMGNVHAIGEAVQITGGETLTWNQIHEIACAALGVEPRIVHVASDFIAACDPEQGPGLLGDKSYSVAFDNTKLERLVPGFRAAIRFDQGARRAVRYLLGHKELQAPDPEFDAWCDRVIAAQEAGLAAFRCGK